MLYKWECQSSRGLYDDLTALQLRELADRGAIQPTDSISRFGTFVPAYKFERLFPNTAFLEILWYARIDASSIPVTVSLDNHFLGRAPFGSWSCFWHEVQLGRHIVGVKLPMRSQKQYVIDIPHDGIYRCELLFRDGFWANFQDHCNVVEGPWLGDGEGNTLQCWSEEYQAALCQHCGAEWAVSFLGKKVLDERQQYKTITQTDMTWAENPNYYIPSPYFTPQYVQVPIERRVQVVAIVSTVREYYQCGHCGKKWKKDCTYEHVP